MKDSVENRDDDVTIAVESGFSVNDETVISFAGSGPEHGNRRLHVTVGSAGPACWSANFDLIAFDRHLDLQMSSVWPTVHDRRQQKASSSFYDLGWQVGSFNSDTHHR